MVYHCPVATSLAISGMPAEPEVVVAAAVAAAEVEPAAADDDDEPAVARPCQTSLVA